MKLKPLCFTSVSTSVPAVLGEDGVGFTVHEKPTWWGCSGHADFLCCQRTDSVRGQRVNLTGGKLPACFDSPLCLYEVGINVLIAVKSQHRCLGGKPENDIGTSVTFPAGRARRGPHGPCTLAAQAPHTQTCCMAVPTLGAWWQRAPAQTPALPPSPQIQIWMPETPSSITKET